MILNSIESFERDGKTLPSLLQLAKAWLEWHRYPPCSLRAARTKARALQQAAASALPPDMAARWRIPPAELDNRTPQRVLDAPRVATVALFGYTSGSGVVAVDGMMQNIRKKALLSSSFRVF